MATSDLAAPSTGERAAVDGESPRPPVTIGVYLPAPDAELVRRRAEAGDRTVSAELRRALRASGYLSGQPTQSSNP